MSFFMYGQTWTYQPCVIVELEERLPADNACAHLILFYSSSYFKSLQTLDSCHSRSPNPGQGTHTFAGNLCLLWASS